MENLLDDMQKKSIPVLEAERERRVKSRLSKLGIKTYGSLDSCIKRFVSKTYSQSIDYGTLVFNISFVCEITREEAVSYIADYLSVVS